MQLQSIMQVCCPAVVCVCVLVSGCVLLLPACLTDIHGVLCCGVLRGVVCVCVA